MTSTCLNKTSFAAFGGRLLSLKLFDHNINDIDNKMIIFLEGEGGTCTHSRRKWFSSSPLSSSTLSGPHSPCWPQRLPSQKRRTNIEHIKRRMNIEHITNRDSR